MAKVLNIRLNDGDETRLREIAVEVGALAPSGMAQGQPSISRMLMMVASGELVVERRETMAERIETTREHLGPDATDQDVQQYEDALDRIAPAFNGDRREASAWLWGEGDYLKRIDAGVCIYCGVLVVDAVTTPEVGDDAAWGNLAAEHLMECEWIATRAHRMNVG